MKNPSQFKEGWNEIDDIQFYVQRKDIKNLIIKINNKNDIVVSIPRKINDKIVRKFLEINLEKFKQISQKNKLNLPINIQEKWFYLFGEKHLFSIDEINKKIIIYNKKISFAKKTIEDCVNTYRKKEFKIYILIKQLQLQKIMNIEDHLIKIREKNTSWATNHVTKKTIYYSINLASFNKEVIDYVIIHELAHNKFPNHSKEFWNFVERYDSDYKAKRIKLRKKIYK